MEKPFLSFRNNSGSDNPRIIRFHQVFYEEKVVETIPEQVSQLQDMENKRLHAPITKVCRMRKN